MSRLLKRVYTILQAFPERQAPQDGQCGERERPGAATKKLGAEVLGKAGVSIDMDNQDIPEIPEKNTRIFAEILTINTDIKEHLAHLASSPSMELMGNGADKYGTTLLQGGDGLVRRFEEMLSRIGQLSTRGEANSPIGADTAVAILQDKVHTICSKLKDDVTKAGLDWQLLKSAYANNVANMNPDWVHRVADAIRSFNINNHRELQRLIPEVCTFNELLHLSHSYVMNDDGLRNSLEIWSDGSPDHRIRGLGRRTKATEEIHQAFLVAWRLGDKYEEAGWRQPPSRIVDIILAGSTLHVIVRDRGHALSMVVNNFTPDQEGEVLVQYTIPKVSNVAMVRQLPGISTVKPGHASGQWTSPVDSLTDNIMSFVKLVPTDFDNPEIQHLFVRK